jgi:amino acid transporter
VIFVVGIVWGGEASLAVEQPMSSAGFGLAMVFVFYAYGGWNDAAFVASEVRDRKRNMPFALLVGTGGIMLIYLLVNAAYLWGLGFEELRLSAAPAADLMSGIVGPWGGRAMSLLVMLSALGAINGLIFTGSRIYVSLGDDHPVFAALGRWNARRGTPVWSLLAQTAIALLWILMVGTLAGQAGVDRVLGWVGLGPLPWANYFGGFNTLVAGTAPVFWVFFLMTTLSLFVLRVKDRGIERPFSAPLFPLEPILFAGMCAYMIYASIDYARGLSLIGLVMLALGLPLYALSQRMGRSSGKFR